MGNLLLKSWLTSAIVSDKGEWLNSKWGCAGVSRYGTISPIYYLKNTREDFKLNCSDNCNYLELIPELA